MSDRSIDESLTPAERRLLDRAAEEAERQASQTEFDFSRALAEVTRPRHRSIFRHRLSKAKTADEGPPRRSKASGLAVAFATIVAIFASLINFSPVANLFNQDQRTEAPGQSQTEPGGLAETTPKTTGTTPLDIPTRAKLQRALLATGDLPGFRVDTSSNGGFSGVDGCRALDTSFSAGAGAQAGVLLYRESSQVYIGEQILQLNPSAARDALSRVGSAPRSCGSFTTSIDVVGKVSMTVNTLGIPPIGDGAVAVRITMMPQLSSVLVYEDLVLIRRGDTLIILTRTSLSTTDDGLTVQAAAEAYAKTERVW